MELWMGSYRMLEYQVIELWFHCSIKAFYQRNPFVYSINVLNFKGMSFVNTSLSVKYDKALKVVLPL